jgi:DNA-directed RNA polymerase subunit alpha
VRIRLLDSKNEGTLVLKKSGPSVITAADIEPSENIEIVNKDYYLGSLADKKAEIEAKMTVEKGLGYSLAEERKVTTIGVVPVDAIYTPVKKVSYRVEQTRVGRQTNYEKLILDIWTDGTISPREALDAAAKILVSYFNNIYEPRDTEQKSEEKRGKDVSRDLLNLTIEELELPTRIYNSLRNAGIQTVGQLFSTPKKDLLSFRNLGAKSLSVIEKSLKEKGISQEF